MSWMQDEPTEVDCDACDGLGYYPLRSGAKAECSVCYNTGKVPYKYLFWRDVRKPRTNTSHKE